MKKLLSLLAATVTELSCFAPVINLTSCSNTYKLSNLEQTVINEFMKLTEIPRPGDGQEGSHTLDKLRTYLQSRAKQIDDNATSEIDTYGNLKIDFPASKGYEDKQGCILQSHMDMVVTGMEKEEAKTTPINAVLDLNNKKDGKPYPIIHSKDYITSIGADDGVGIALALSILNDSNVKHGPIRCLFTADEDIGMLGAAQVPAEWFRGYQYLLNIDAEKVGDVFRSCAGGVRHVYDKTFDYGTDARNKYLYELNVDNLHGGHSADVDHYASAEALLMKILDKANTSLGFNQLAGFDHYHFNKEGIWKDESYGGNVLSNNGRVFFWSNSEKNDLDSFVKTQVNNFQQGIYKNEVDLASKVTLTLHNDAESIQEYTNHISLEDSKKLIHFMGGDFDESKGWDNDCLPFGRFENPSFIGTNIGCANICPLSIKNENNKLSINLMAMDRANEPTFFDNMKTYTENVWPYDSSDISISSIYFPWVHDESNKLIGWAVDAYKTNGVTPSVVDVSCGVEPSWWVKKASEIGQTLYCVGIGCDVIDPHNTTEKWGVNSTVPVYKTIQSILQQISQQ